MLGDFQGPKVSVVVKKVSKPLLNMTNCRLGQI